MVDDEMKEVEDLIKKVVSTVVLVGKYGGVMMVWLDKEGNINLGYAIEEGELNELVNVIESSVQYGSRQEILKDYEASMKELTKI